jgi:hypothetical protein
MCLENPSDSTVDATRKPSSIEISDLHKHAHHTAVCSFQTPRSKMGQSFHAIHLDLYDAEQGV